MLIDDLSSKDSNEIRLPYLYSPRPYQQPLLQAMVPELYPPTPTELDIMLDQKPATPPHVRNAVCVWHRRAGKDKTSINILACRALIDTPGYYLYMAPEAAQVRKILWQGMGSDGMKFIDHIPAQLITKKLDKEMYIELVNGSSIQLCGADNYDSLVGTNPRGIVFSEYSIQDPAALRYFRPMLLENKGWAVFIYTPRGHNHGYNLHKTARQRTEEGNAQWFHQKVTIDESVREDGTPIVTREEYEQEIADGMPEATAMQEFYCDFDQGMPGAYYADQIASLYHQQGIGYYPHDPSMHVITAWDLGLNDSTAIWFIQPTEQGPRVIDYEAEANVPMTEWIRRVKEKPYNYFEHIGPHDLNVRDAMTGITRIDRCRDLGLDFRIAPKLSRQDGIDAVRAVLPTCRFNENTCDLGLESLMSYERVYDDKLKTFKDTPLHNWACHGADAFRYFAIMWNNYKDLYRTQPEHYVISSAGTKHRKGGSALPPLVSGGQVRRNGEHYR
jgi:phage terminase large subunit